jgi:hypothetical protein
MKMAARIIVNAHKVLFALLVIATLLMELK